MDLFLDVNSVASSFASSYVFSEVLKSIALIVPCLRQMTIKAPFTAANVSPMHTMSSLNADAIISDNSRSRPYCPLHEDRTA